MEVIQTALQRKLPALSEHQSKAVLNAYGIPTTREKLVPSAREAVAAADAIGYPVVLKACSPYLMHKSEKGCIRFNLDSPRQVQQACHDIMDTVEEDIDGILVQETIEGQRELTMGLTRDSQFGPCVMLGLGGTATEIFKDSVFRVAPFDRAEALDMTEELRSKAMLGPFRGQEQADIATICDCLLALAAIGLKHSEISEIDINPLIIDPQGRVTAVDALVVLQEPVK
ncbi:MAG: carboxylate--amine ligase [Desulfobacteraceae bacterium]|nr:carboxylate--amine ligase [Desulfobacteraceae bacterium]